jgi:hypothetical protein
MDKPNLPNPYKFKYKWKSPYDYNNTFTVPHIYALVYDGVIKYIGKSSGTRSNYYTGGVIPNKVNKLGIKGVLEFVTLEEIDEREIFWINKYKPKYNIAEGGKGGLIGNLNPAKRKEVRDKISESNKGKKFSKEHKLKLREAKLKNPVKAHLNKPRSEETKSKIKQTYQLKYSEKYDNIRLLIEQGYYVREIVKLLNVSTATIAKIKKTMGTTSKHNRRRK